MSYRNRLLSILSMLALLAPARPVASLDKLGTADGGEVDPARAIEITVSGVVAGPGGLPLAGVWVGIGSDIDWKEDVTDAAGGYGVTIQTEGVLHYHVHPDPVWRLVQINLWTGGVNGNVVRNFALEAGNLLRVRPTSPGGELVAGDYRLEDIPLIRLPAEDQWTEFDRDEATGFFSAVLPPDVHYITVRQPPAGYYETTRPFDLRAGDVQADLPLDTHYVHPIPYDPPDAGQITIGPPDDLGEAEVVGGPGAVLPLARVLLVNLNSAHQVHTVSDAEGRFAARIYAPPGSAVMVKHGPADWRWRALEQGVSEGINPFPGTIIQVTDAHTGGEHSLAATTARSAAGLQGDSRALPFAAAGGIDVHIDDPAETRNYVGAAWAVAGAIGPVSVEGEWSRVLTGTVDGQTMPGYYLGGLNWTHPALGDLDADGDLELLFGEREGHLVLFRNQGTPAAPDWRFETAEYAGVEAGWWAYPALADVYGDDGAPDLLVGLGDGAVRIYVNAGTPAAPLWPELPDLSLPAGPGAAPALMDLNDDGTLDLLIGCEGGSLIHYENTGTRAAPVWTHRTDDYAGIHETNEWGDPIGLQPAFMDLDGDNDRDLLLGRGAEMGWYRNDGPPANPTWTRVTGSYMGWGFSSAVSPGLGDWDDDGDLDLVTGEHWGTPHFYRNDALAGPTALTARRYGRGYGLGHPAPTLTAGGNELGDPAPTLTAGGYGLGHPAPTLTTSGPPVWQETGFPLPLDLAGDTAPALGDWDADGDLDLLLAQVHGSVFMFVNQGDETEPDWHLAGEAVEPLPWTNHPHPFPVLADIDGDDDLDLFVGEGSWEGPEAGGTIRFYQNVGTAYSPDWVLSTTDYLGQDLGGWSAPALADLDADLDLDLLVGDADGTLTLVENTGAPDAPAWAAPQELLDGLSLGAHSVPCPFDLDQDGDLDLLVGLEHGSLGYLRNAGSPNSPAWELVSTLYPAIDVGELATPAAGDLNGDHLPDLLLGEGDGGVDLYRYLGPGTLPAVGHYQPGDPFQVEGMLRLYSHAITATTDVEAIAAHGWLVLVMQHTQDGLPLPKESYFMSTLLTPAGFPIQRPGWPAVEGGAPVEIRELGYVGGHAIAGSFGATGWLPEDLPPGIYRPVIWLGFEGVPTSTAWLAANVTQYTFGADQAPLAPITVGDTAPPRLAWRLLMDDFVQGTRGTAAREDQGTFEIASQIVSQGAPYYAPPVDQRTGVPISYRLEPFLPMISFTDRRMPAAPLIPFDLPGGSLSVQILGPDGTLRDLGQAPLAQSFNRTKTTRRGGDLNSGTIQMEDVYSLKADSDRFRVTFEQSGRYVITMTGVISDLWGNAYQGGGTYQVWMAQPLDIDPGVLPGTPLAVGDAFNPAMQFYPRVPAEVELTLTLYPDSDPERAEVHTLRGRANRYGYFDGSPAGRQAEGLVQGAETAPLQPIRQCGTALDCVLTQPGELRIDVTARYTDTAGTLYMGAMTWGGVVMTPPQDAKLVAHGRRGVDSLQHIPHFWYLSQNLSIPPGAISHSLNPYLNGDIYWSRMSDGPFGGDSLVMGASVHDKTAGTIETVIRQRAERYHLETAGPGSLEERFEVDEIPLFISTRSGRPPQLVVGQLGGTVPTDVDQIAYSYRSSQRPGVRVREVVAEDGQSGGYWRLDTLYDDQLGVGVLGDQVNDFKFQYVGTVYRDLDKGLNEYGGQGTGWIFIPDDDPTGSRVMPPFAGYGAWPDDGGPLLRLQGRDITMFILPTGVRPGAVLEVGDTFRFAGHLMPTLDSHIAVTITAPEGPAAAAPSGAAGVALHTVDGQANPVGYFYDPADDFIVDRPGLWSVDVRIWHDGAIGSGDTVLCAAWPDLYDCPSGDVLGSESGRYWFYVVPRGRPRLDVSAPSPGYLTFDSGVTPITIAGSVPPGLSDALLDYTISMPGYILQHGQVAPAGGTYQVLFDPVAVQQTFPNLDLIGRDDGRPGLSDTFAIGLLLQGTAGGQTAYYANTVTLQGQQVYVGSAPAEPPQAVYLPLVVR